MPGRLAAGPRTNLTRGTWGLDAADWARTLLATEIVFVSDLAGSGVEWSTTTGRDDAATIKMLRAIQRKLARTVSPYYGKRPSE